MAQGKKRSSGPTLPIGTKNRSGVKRLANSIGKRPAYLSKPCNPNGGTWTNAV